jgi:hypothetical protein
MTYLNGSLALAAGEALSSAFALRNTICLLNKEIGPKYVTSAWEWLDGRNSTVSRTVYAQLGQDQSAEA